MYWNTVIKILTESEINDAQRQCVFDKSTYEEAVDHLLSYIKSQREFEIFSHMGEDAVERIRSLMLLAIEDVYTCSLDM